MIASVYYCGYTSMTLWEPTVQHFLLLAHLYSQRNSLSVCHNQTSVCSKASTAPMETHSEDPCKQPAFCWVQFLRTGKSAARSTTPVFSSIHRCVKICGLLVISPRSGVSGVLQYGCPFLCCFFHFANGHLCSPVAQTGVMCSTWSLNGNQLRHVFLIV